MATKASCRPRRSIDSSSMPGAAVDQRLEQRLDARPRAARTARSRRSSSRVGRQRARARRRPALRVLSRTCGRSRSRASATRPSKRIRPSAMIAIRSHSRSAWWMTWVEKMTVVPGRRLVADQMLEPALVDRVEAGKGLVEHDQLRLVDDRAEQLDGLRHALGQALDRLVDIVAEAVLPEQDLGALAARRRAAGRAARP